MAALIAVAYAGCYDTCDSFGYKGALMKACKAQCDDSCATCPEMEDPDLKATCEETYCGAGEVISSLFAVAAAAAFAMFN